MWSPAVILTVKCLCGHLLTATGNSGHAGATSSSSSLIFFSLFIFFPLSTAAVVYTIACLYTAREITFKKIMNVVPKVWKRLIVTFFTIFVALFLYLAVAVIVLLIWAVSVGQIHVVGVVVLAALVILFMVGFLYLTTIWHLASIVTVLEDAYGFQAIVKSKNLIKGKLWLAMSVFVVLNLVSGINQIAFKRLVVEGTGMGMANRVFYAIICFLLLFAMINIKHRKPLQRAVWRILLRVRCVWTTQAQCTNVKFKQPL